MIDQDRDIRSGVCDCCDTPFERVTGFINKEGVGAYAIYFATCHHRRGVHEAYIDVILDDQWDPDAPVSRPGPNRVTFGCRVGPVDGQSDPACSLVPAASTEPHEAFFGRKLNRDQALEHPWLSAYWEVVDHILERDATVQGHFH